MQSLGLMKDRMNLELDIVKKQMGLGSTTLLGDMKKQINQGVESQGAFDKGS